MPVLTWQPSRRSRERCVHLPLLWMVWQVLPRTSQEPDAPQRSPGSPVKIRTLGVAPSEAGRLFKHASACFGEFDQVARNDTFLVDGLLMRFHGNRNANCSSFKFVRALLFTSSVPWQTANSLLPEVSQVGLLTLFLSCSFQRALLTEWDFFPPLQSQARQQCASGRQRR